MTDRVNAPTDLEQLKSDHRALAFLRVLEREPGFRLNDRVMLDWLRSLALVSTIDELRDCVTSLESHGLISVEHVGKIKVFTLTDMGQEVGVGQRTIEGISRPQPDCDY